MRFYRKEIPSEGDTVIACIEKYDKDSSAMTMSLPEYEGHIAYLMHIRVDKKRKKVNNFVKKRKKYLTPYFIDNVENGIPNLTPIRSEDEWNFAMNRFHLFKSLEGLTDDIIFQKLCDKDYAYDKFLWTLTEKLSDEKFDNDNMFKYYLSKIDVLLEMAGMDEDRTEKVKANILERITSSKVTINSSINVSVLTKNGLKGLSVVLKELCKHVDAVYYQNPPMFNVTIKRESEEKCIEELRCLEEKLKRFSEENDIKAILHYNENDEVIKEKDIRLKTINKT